VAVIAGSKGIVATLGLSLLGFLGPMSSTGAEEAKSQNIIPSRDFPEGTATPSEQCGACHQAIYREYREGLGSDLHWKGMKPFPSSERVLSLPAGVPLSATAHSVAGIDPWPLEATRVEEHGKRCIVCHYPQPLAYPALLAEKIAKPTPRPDNQEAGITCASCHLTPEGKIRGPYALETPAPHETVKDEQILSSVACATCHSVGERIVGKQTQTFLEWREDFMKAGLGSQQCQDCHMPRTIRKLAEDFDVPERVVGRHLSTGGHSFQRVRSALNLAIVPAEDGQSGVAFHVTNVGAGHSVPTGSNRRAVYLTAEIVGSDSKIVASKEWMFAPWFADHPDDRKFVEEDLKGPEPVAAPQADAQGPHETIIRAGEDRVLNWQPVLDAGSYTVRATLTYDINRYNDRAFKEDQYEIGSASVPLKVATQPAAAPKWP
jgi:hypothetical protein